MGLCPRTIRVGGGYRSWFRSQPRGSQRSGSYVVRSHEIMGNLALAGKHSFGSAIAAQRLVCS